MSTYLYLECQDHEPPIRAEDESGQYLRDLPRIREEITHRAEVVAWADDPDTYKHERDGGHGQPDSASDFTENSVAFLRHHPNCTIRIVTEFGEDVTEKEAPLVDGYTGVEVGQQWRSADPREKGSIRKTVVEVSDGKAVLHGLRRSTVTLAHDRDGRTTIPRHTLVKEARA